MQPENTMGADTTAGDTNANITNQNGDETLNFLVNEIDQIDDNQNQYEGELGSGGHNYYGSGSNRNFNRND